jgi:hypothetical protein
VAIRSTYYFAHCHPPSSVLALVQCARSIVRGEWSGLDIVHHRRPIAVAGVMVTNNTAVAPVIRRARSGISQDSNAGELSWSGSSHGKPRSYRCMGRNSLFLHRPGYTGDEDSFYGDRRRSHFTGQVRHYGRVGEVLLKEEIQQGRCHDIDRGGALSRARHIVRSKKQGARIIFGTKLDGQATRSTAGNGRGA